MSVAPAVLPRARGRRADREGAVRALGARLAGPVCVVASSLSLQSAAALATTIFVVFGPAGTAGLRFAAGAALLLAVARPRLRGRSARTWLPIAVFGASTAGASLCLFAALDRVPLGTAVTLQFLGPLAVALIGARRRLDLAWAAAAAAGVVLVTGGADGGPASGYVLALGAAACVAVSVWSGARVAAATTGLDGLALAVAVAAAVTLPFSLPALAGTPDAGALASAAAVGALGVAVPYALFYVALRRVGARTYGVLLSLDPAVAALIGLVALGQHLGLAAVLGIALVMVASAGAVGTQPPAGAAPREAPRRRGRVRRQAG